MSASTESQLISAIYDIAVDEDCLGEALVSLAELTRCRAVSLEVYSSDPVRFVVGRNPLISAEHAQSYIDYWRHHLPKRGSSGSFPVGKVLSSADLWNRDTVVKSGFYNDWLRPQGLGGDGRYANVAKQAGSVAVLGAFKPFQSPEFSRSQQRLFRLAAHHFSRAIEINRRLRDADLVQEVAEVGLPASGFIIVDFDGRILSSHEKTHRRLCAAGLVSGAGDLGFLGKATPGLMRLIHRATDHRDARASSEFRMRGINGEDLQLSITPLSAHLSPKAPWLATQRPAALVQLSLPDDAVLRRVQQLAAVHSLTRAEQRVVIETIKGGGRAAVAKQLGLSETTVRSHLSSIFAKLGVRRQAELCRMVLSC